VLWQVGHRGLELTKERDAVGRPQKGQAAAKSGNILFYNQGN